VDSQNPVIAPRFVLAVPFRTDYYNAYARALHGAGLLRFYALGTRRGIPMVPPERTRLNPWIGLWTVAAVRALGTFQAESFRFRLLPWFDRWVLQQLEPADHILSSYGYANQCFRFIRQHGGKTFVDAGNSHIENFWEVLTEEQRRWNSPYPPVARHWYERSRAMLAEGVDFVLSPSSYVTRSFLARGYKPEQILRNIYPVDLSLFQPSGAPRPKDRPLTLINTGALCLRKGTPYLLEAFRLVRRQEPSARLLLTQDIRNDVEPILARYRDLPIEWSPRLRHDELVERLRNADAFVLPSLEEGLVRTALEAMACGLQVVLTPNTGANDFVRPGVNGEIVPIRDPKATAEAILKCWERVQAGQRPEIGDLQEKLSFETFAREFLAQLREHGVAPAEQR
jgi:glycosyltransferase involved in cell wall biosynthesis